MGQKWGRFNPPISQSWPSFDGGQKGQEGQVFEKGVLQKPQPPSPITPKEDRDTTSTSLPSGSDHNKDRIDHVNPRNMLPAHTRNT